MMTDFNKAYRTVGRLVQDFRAHEHRYLSPDYQEAEARKDFIDKFWKALGWDVGDAEFFVSPETLAEACSFHVPFWEELEVRWRQERPSDFDYRGQHKMVSGEPSMIHFWRTPEFDR